MAGKNGVKYPYWQEIVDRQSASGLSIRAFCRQEGISEPSFYSWRRKLQGSNDGQVRARRRGDDDGSGGFIPLTLLESHSTLEIIHPLGYRIRVTGDVDAAALQRVFDVLDGRDTQ